MKIKLVRLPICQGYENDQRKIGNILLKIEDIRSIEENPKGWIYNDICLITMRDGINYSVPEPLEILIKKLNIKVI